MAMPDLLSHDMQAWTASSQQHIFRQLMRAFSYPGRIETLATSGAHALTLTLAALIDRGSSLADPQNLLDDFGYTSTSFRIRCCPLCVPCPDSNVHNVNFR